MDKSQLQYDGAFTGLLSDNSTYSCTIGPAKLLRNFNCTFKNSTPGNSAPPQTAPAFILGKMQYTNSKFNPIEMNFGPAQSCDSTGVVSVNAKSYQVDFWK